MTSDNSKNLDSADVMQDVRAAANVVGFCARAVWRRRRLAGITAAVAFAVLVLILASLPKSYESGFRIQTDRGTTIPTLVNVQGTSGTSGESVARGANELLHSRSYLRSLIDAVQLATHWSEGRSLPLRLKDKVRELAVGPLNQDEMEAVLRKMLSDRIRDEVEGSGVIRFTVTWSSPEMAHTLAQAALKLFLDQRRDTELNQIHDTMTILEDRLERSRLRVNQTADLLATMLKEKQSEVQRKMGATLTSRPQTRVLSFRRAEVVPPGEVREVNRGIDETSAHLERVEREYQGQLARARERLEGLKKTLGPEHPDLKQGMRDLEALSVPSSELEALRAEHNRLRSQASGTGDVAATSASASNRFEVVKLPMTGDVYAAMVADPDVENLMNELNKYVQDYGQLVDRHENAEIALEATRAAFNYRYVVTEPPAFPNGVKSPTPQLIIFGALAVALLLGFAAAVGADIATRRVLEAWQVEAFLGVPVCGRTGRR